MSKNELVYLSAQLKQTLQKFVPEQNVTAAAGFLPGTNTVTLSFCIEVPGGYQPATGDAMAWER